VRQVCAADGPSLHVDQQLYRLAKLQAIFVVKYIWALGCLVYLPHCVFHRYASRLQLAIIGCEGVGLRCCPANFGTNSIQSKCDVVGANLSGVQKYDGDEDHGNGAQD